MAEILEMFDSVLVGKPKVFIFQACRVLPKGNNATNPSRKLKRLGKDVFIWQSTLEKIVTKRDIVHGAYFIRCLCLVISKCGLKDDIFGIFTKVNYLMTKFQIDQQYLKPSTMSASPTKLFYFKPILH